MRKWMNLWLMVWLSSGFTPASPAPQQQLSLQDAIAHALQHNLELQVEVTNTEYYWQALQMNQAAFIPSLEISASDSQTNTPSTSVFAGADINTVDTSSLDLTLSQPLILGGTLEVSLDNTRRETNSIFSTINPSLSSILTFSLSQPLLKGFGPLANKKDIYIAANDYTKYTHQVKQQVIDLVYSVEEAYWNLVYAYQNLTATQTSLQRAQDLLKQNEIKVKVGTAAPIDILEAKAEVASYESQIIQREKEIQTAEETLKKILNMSQSDAIIRPSDTPTVVEEDLDFNRLLLRALQHRPDIRRAKLDLKNYNINVRYYRNQMLPDLQLTASYYTTGQGGDLLIFDRNPFFGGQVIATVNKDIWETLQDNVSNLYRNYSINLNLTIPLSFSRERAQLAQAKINLKKALLEMQNIENTIYSEVKEVIKEVEANLKLVEASRVALELEAQKLQAEQKKLAVGLSTNFQVLNFQRDYAAAETSALKAVIDYNLSLSRLNRIVARTFSVYNIKFDRFITH